MAIWHLYLMKWKYLVLEIMGVTKNEPLDRKLDVLRSLIRFPLRFQPIYDPVKISPISRSYLMRALTASDSRRASE
jgi:hypothetical protein